MTKLNSILQELGKKGYKINKEVVIGSGKNGIVFKLTGSGNKTYALKVINGKRLPNGKNRAEQEAKFTEYLDSIGTDKHPALVEYSGEKNWILTNWLKGEKVKEFNEKNIGQVVNFIKEINHEKDKPKRKALSHAIDSYRSPDDSIKDIDNRMIKFEKMNAGGKDERFREILYKYIEKNIEIVEGRKKQLGDQGWWKGADDELIASPSDIGIHNTIANNNIFYFFDFEYAGLDDMSKLICDLVLQPENILNTNIEQSIIKEITKATGNEEWIKRYELIKPMNIAKWTLIILNNKGDEETSLKKARKYFFDAIRIQGINPEWIKT